MSSSHKPVDESTDDSVYRNTNGVPRYACGRVTHLAVKEGEVANRIISVGSASRALTIATQFDHPDKMFRQKSARGFDIYTGTFQSVPVSVIATGMGIANMDFVVRETRAIVKGPMAIVRFGTCGGLTECLDVGSIAVAGKGSVMITRNPNFFHAPNDHSQKHDAYLISNHAAPACENLSANLMKEFEVALEGKHKVENTLNVTACSFYSSQGRVDHEFNDQNHRLHEDLLEKHPESGTMEMETFHLFDLANSSKGSIAASAAVIVVANRKVGTVVDDKTLDYLEKQGGQACLRAICNYSFGGK